MNYTKIYFSLLVLIVIGLFVYAGRAEAALTKQLSYQGRLQDASGNPVANGTYTVVLSIYNVNTGGTALYTETQNVTVDKGGFSVYIGSVTPLTLPFNEDYFLGIKVGSDPEMTPRLKLAVAGTAVFAMDAANLGGQPSSTYATSSHTHPVVSQIVAGTNVTISPTNGTGVVTINTSGGGGGTPAISVTSVGASAVVGTSTNYAREDHVHNIPAGLITDGMINASAGIAKSKLNLSNSILFSDIAQNGCASGQVVEWNGTAWNCGTDDTGAGGIVTNPASTQTIIAGNSSTTPLVLKGAAGTTVPMFEVQDSAGVTKLGVMPDGHVYIPSTNQLHVLNVNNDSPTGPMGDITIDVNGTGNTKLILTNSNPTRLADLSVEGNVLVGNPTTITAKVSAYETGMVNYGGSFEINNASNSSALLFGNTTGTGNLLQLQLSGVDKFVVNNSGRINTVSVDTGSIVDSTILFADVAANGCAGNDVMKFNGTAWVCGSGVATQWTTSGADIYYNSGKVGIGTTAPIRQLSIDGGGASTVSGIGITNVEDAVTEFSLLAIGSSHATLGSGTAGDINLVLGRSGFSDIVIKENGNVGIGTKVPTAKLHVDTSAAQAVMFGNTTSTGNLLQLQVSAVDKFIVTNAGNALVGNPAWTTAKVSAEETGTANVAGYFKINNASNANSAVRGVTTGTGEAGLFQVINASSSGPAVTGTTSGTGNAASFAISNAGNASAVIAANSTGTGPILKGLQDGSGDMLLFKTAADTVTKFRVDFDGKMSFNTGANMPVGTGSVPMSTACTTVANTLVTAGSFILLMINSVNTAADIEALKVKNIVNATGFDVCTVKETTGHTVGINFGYLIVN